MTIDEAIQIEKYFGKKDKKALEELQKEFPMIYGIMNNNLHENIVEWLEELKFRRVLQLQCEKEFFAGYEKGKTEGYSKAIDEFAERIKQGDVIEYMGSYVSYKAIVSFIDEIAEQMKGGATDERTGSY